jgi:hypothetical protein
MPARHRRGLPARAHLWRGCVPGSASGYSTSKMSDRCLVCRSRALVTCTTNQDQSAAYAGDAIVIIHTCDWFTCAKQQPQRRAVLSSIRAPGPVVVACRARACACAALCAGGPPAHLVAGPPDLDGLAGGDHGGPHGPRRRVPRLLGRSVVGWAGMHARSTV